MSVKVFIPALWAAGVLRQLEKVLIYAQPGICNRNYQGQIQQEGDRVKINSIGPVTVSTYTPGSDIADPEDPVGAEQWLIIDQYDYFNVGIEDIYNVQTRPELMTPYLQEAAYSFADETDQYVAAQLAANVSSANTIGSTSTPKTDLGTAGYAYNYLVQLGQKLSEANVPRSMRRWVIVPPWFTAEMSKHGQTLLTDTPVGDEIRRNGFFGRVAGFDVYESNNVPNTSNTKYKIIAGVDMAATYADQILKTEMYRPEKRFSEAVKGLHVYGMKIVRPNALAMLIANPPS